VVKGRTIGNIIIERFFHRLKYEEVYINDYDNPQDARRSIRAYLEKYNYGGQKGAFYIFIKSLLCLYVDFALLLEKQECFQ